MTNTLNKVIHNGDEYEFPWWISNITTGTTSTVSGIRVWTDAEYGLITPEEWQISIVYSGWWGGWGWQPTNPFCWYKFDWDMTDSTWTFGNASWTSSFQTLSSWIQVLQTDWTNRVLLPSGVTQNAMTTYTISFWMKVITTSPTYWYYMGDEYNNGVGMSFYESTSGRNYYEWTGWSITNFNTRDITPSWLSTWWRLVTLRSNWTWRSNVSLTINASNIVTSWWTSWLDSSSIFWNGMQLAIWARWPSLSASGTVTSIQISNFVISQTYWDDAAVLDMYDQTKANYWVS